jgi:zinc protease
VTTLENGLRIYVVERQGSGIEAVRLLIKRGASWDPADLPGLASMTAEMMEAGSAGKSQAEIAAEADAIGATLVVEAGQDALTVGLSTMNEKLPRMVKLLADVSLRPNFDRKEWKRLKAQREAELLAQRAEPRVGASLAWKAAAYGPHVLGRPQEGTPESVKAMELAQVKSFFQGFSPKDAALVAVGGVPEAEVVKQLAAAFSGWKAPRKEAVARPRGDLPPDRPRLVMVDFPEKSQSYLLVGQPAPPRSSPDYLALTLLNSVLGGSFTSRLNQNLREAHGYTYGASSRFSFGVDPGPFQARAQVKTEVTGPALREMLKELERVVAEPLSDEEMRKGRALLAFDLVQMLERADSLAAGISAIFVYDLPLDEYRTFVDRLTALTAEEVRAAAARTLQPGKMTIAVAGDRQKVEPQLKDERALALPSPQLRDPEGKLVKGPETKG